MQKYLLTTTTVFVDPHGTPDDGGITKSIVSGKQYDEQYAEQRLPENKELQFNGDEWVDPEDMNGSEDGYNAQYDFEVLKKLTDEKAEEFKNIISSYNKIQ